jgi:aquaporin Z
MCPAVTVAMWLDKRTDTTDLIGYLIAQFVGAVLASVVLLVATSEAAVVSTITRHAETSTGLIAEFVLTAVFVLVILAATRRAQPLAALAIPLTLAGVHFAGIPFSGASVNPARSFGPALVGTEFTGFWVYVVGPLAGAVAAWAVWRLFGKDETG